MPEPLPTAQSARPSISPALSIVTVCYNSAETLERTIRSIASQRFEEDRTEFVIIDGGSSDETGQIIRKWSDLGVVNRFLIEEDEGIYDAMNKAIQLVSGRYVVFINSDDELADGALVHCLDAADQSPSYFYGNARVESQDGSLRRWIGNSSRIGVDAICCHQALWINTEVLRKLGGFNTSAGLSADYDLMWRLFLSYGIGLKINHDLAIYYLGGASCSNIAASSHFDVKVRYMRQTHDLLRGNGRFADEFRLIWLGWMLACGLGYEKMLLLKPQLQALGANVVIPLDARIWRRLTDKLMLMLVKYNFRLFRLFLALLAKAAKLRQQSVLQRSIYQVSDEKPKDSQVAMEGAI